MTLLLPCVCRDVSVMLRPGQQTRPPADDADLTSTMRRPERSVNQMTPSPRNTTHSGIPFLPVSLRGPPTGIRAAPSPVETNRPCFICAR